MSEIGPDEATRKEVVSQLALELLKELHSDPAEVDPDEMYYCLSAVPLELNPIQASGLKAWLGFLAAENPEVRLAAHDALTNAVENGAMTARTAGYVGEVAAVIRYNE